MLRMFQQGFAAGQEAERRHWLASAAPEMLLHHVIGVLAGALDDSGRKGETA
jgi:hypothetical protein